MIAFVGSIERRISFVAFELKVTAVNDYAAECRRVSVEIFRRGVNNYICSEIFGTAQNGSCKRIVDREQYAVLLRYCGNFIEVEYDYRRISDRFGEYYSRLIVDEFFYFFGGVVGIEEPALYAEFGQGGGEKIVSAAVNRLRRKNVVASAGNGKYSKGGCAHSGSTAYTAHTAFKRGNLTFESRHGGVGKTGIKISVAFKVEQVCHILRLFIDVSRRLGYGRYASLACFG